VAVEDEVVEADVEVVGIAGVAGQPVVAVTAGDPVVAEITDDPVLAIRSSEPVVIDGAADECHAEPSSPLWETRSRHRSPVDLLVTAGWQDSRHLGRGVGHEQPKVVIP
jgi:hypothetical protein